MKTVTLSVNPVPLTMTFLPLIWNESISGSGIPPDAAFVSPDSPFGYWAVTTKNEPPGAVGATTVVVPGPTDVKKFDGIGVVFGVFER